MNELTSYLAKGIIENEAVKKGTQVDVTSYREVIELVIDNNNQSARGVIRIPNQYILTDIIIIGYDGIGNLHGISFYPRDRFTVQFTGKNSQNKWSNMPEDIALYALYANRPIIPELFTNDKEIEIEIYHKETTNKVELQDKIDFPAIFTVHIIGLKVR